MGLQRPEGGRENMIWWCDVGDQGVIGDCSGGGTLTCLSIGSVASGCLSVLVASGEKRKLLGGVYLSRLL